MPSEIDDLAVAVDQTQTAAQIYDDRAKDADTNAGAIRNAARELSAWSPTGDDRVQSLALALWRARELDSHRIARAKERAVAVAGVALCVSVEYYETGLGLLAANSDAEALTFLARSDGPDADPHTATPVRGPRPWRGRRRATGTQLPDVGKPALTHGKAGPVFDVHRAVVHSDQHTITLTTPEFSLWSPRWCARR